MCNASAVVAAAATKNAVATLIAFLSTYSINCLVYLSFSLLYFYIHYLVLRLNYLDLRF